MILFSNLPFFSFLGQSSVASFYLPQDIGGIAYFELPFSIMGNNIKSYGGYLTYILNYRGRGQGPNNSPDIIIIVSLKKDTGILDFPVFNFRNFLLNAVFDSILFSSPLALLSSNLDLPSLRFPQ